MKKAILIYLFCLITLLIYSQPTVSTFALPKGAAYLTVTSDLDCIVKLNNSTKIVPVENNRMLSSVNNFSIKTGVPTSFIIKAGTNKIEFYTSDNKNIINKTVVAKANERPEMEIKFLGDNKFLEYVKTGNLLMVEGALNKNPALLNDDDGILLENPLEVAIVNSKIEIVKLFIKKGVDLEKAKEYFPLHKVVAFASNTVPKNGSEPDDKVLVELLLSKGFKITDKDDAGNTPLHVAARANKLELAKYFVEKGANINAKNVFEDTPLSIAQDKGFISVIDYLKSKDAKDK